MSLISGNVTFGADAINCSSSSILGAAAFIDTASNQGTVSVASFSDTAVNEGTAASAVFSDGAVNVGSLTSGTFLGTAVNSGVVTVAEFFGTASNVGVIVEAAKFADTSSNVGIVSGSAIFADTSISDGVVEGAVQLGVNVTEGENQALTETPTEYTQADGFFPNAHYSSGSKAAPANYATVVYQVGGFWYKYDGNGDGSLASGNYSDGTASVFTFASGIKGASVLKNGIYSDGYYVDGVIEPFYHNLTPQQAQDDGLWYTYVNGTPILANDLLLESSLYYSYSSGVRTLAQGSYNLGNAGNDYIVDGEVTNLNGSDGNTIYSQIDGTYTPWKDKFYSLGTPYTGSAFYADDEYNNPTMRMDFVDGVEVYNGPNI
jgi:hypothetical protein